MGTHRGTGDPLLNTIKAANNTQASGEVLLERDVSGCEKFGKFLNGDDDHY